MLFKNFTVSLIVLSDSPGFPTIANAPVDITVWNFFEISKAFRICCREIFFSIFYNISSEPDSIPQHICRHPASTIQETISSDIGVTLHEHPHSILIFLLIISLQIALTLSIPRLKVSSWKKIFLTLYRDIIISISSTTLVTEYMRTFCPQ